MLAGMTLLSFHLMHGQTQLPSKDCPLMTQSILGKHMFRFCRKKIIFLIIPRLISYYGEWKSHGLFLPTFPLSTFQCQQMMKCRHY